MLGLWVTWPAWGFLKILQDSEGCEADYKFIDMKEQEKTKYRP